MPQEAQLPIDEPVARPKASPGEFSIPGSTIAGLGEESEQLASDASAIEGHLLAAQRQLKAKEAEIAVDRVKNQIHAQLSKATTPEDVQAIYQSGTAAINETLAPYETDRWMARQLGIYRQQEEVELQGTVNAKRADIITKSDHAANAVLGEKKLTEAINTQIGGGDHNVPRAQFEMQLQSSVAHGTMLPQEAAAVMAKWDKEYEGGYIEAQLNSPNLQTVQDTITDLRLHPEKYPHLDKGELNALATKGESSVASRLSLQDEINGKAEEKQYWNQSPTGIPKLFTDERGNFDEARANSYVAGLGLSPDGEQMLLKNIKVHASATDAKYQKTATEYQDQVVKAFHDRDYGKAGQLLEQYRPFWEGHGFGEVYKAMTNFGDAQREHERAEAREQKMLATEEEQVSRQKWQDDSYNTLYQIQSDLQQGKRHSDTEIYSMAGRGKGKLMPNMVNDAIRLEHSYETDPANKPFFNSIWNSQLPAQNQGEAIIELNNFIEKNPTANETQKAAAVKGILDPKHQELVNKSIDALGDVLSGKPIAPSNQQQPPSIPGPVGNIGTMLGSDGNRYWVDKNHKSLGAVQQ